MQTELRFPLTLDNVLISLGNVPDTLIFQTIGTRAPVVSLIDSPSLERYTTKLWTSLHASGYTCRDVVCRSSYDMVCRSSYDVVSRSSEVVGRMDVVQVEGARYRAELEDALGRFIKQECMDPNPDTVPSPQMVRALAAIQVLAGKEVSEFVGMMAQMLASK